MKGPWLWFGRSVGFAWEIFSMAVPIATVLWAFGAPLSAWRIALLGAFGVYMVGIVERHFLKRFGKIVLQSVFGDFHSEKTPAFAIGDVVVFDHTSSGMNAEGAQIVAVFSTGKLAFEMGVEKSAFEMGWVRPGAYYGLAIARVTEEVEEDREAFVVLPETMLKLVTPNTVVGSR